MYVRFRKKSEIVTTGVNSDFLSKSLPEGLDGVDLTAFSVVHITGGRNTSKRYDEFVKQNPNTIVVCNYEWRNGFGDFIHLPEWFGSQTSKVSYFKSEGLQKREDEERISKGTADLVRALTAYLKSKDISATALFGGFGREQIIADIAFPFGYTARGVKEVAEFELKLPEHLKEVSRRREIIRKCQEKLAANNHGSLISFAEDWTVYRPAGTPETVGGTYLKDGEKRTHSEFVEPYGKDAIVFYTFRLQSLTAGASSFQKEAKNAYDLVKAGRAFFVPCLYECESIGDSDYRYCIEVQWSDLPVDHPAHGKEYKELFGPFGSRVVKNVLRKPGKYSSWLVIEVL